MDQPTSYADYLKVWQHRLRALDANTDDFAHMMVQRQRLQNILDRANAALQDQSAAAAEKQDASRRVEALLVEGRVVAAFLNAGIRELYGKDSEKLAEFGLQPFRGRRPRTLPPPPPTPEDAQ